MKIRNLFNNRTFDSVGLVEVLFTIVTAVFAVFATLGFGVICIYWPKIVMIALISSILLILISVGIYNAFNMIFPKKINEDEELERLNKWLYDVKNAFKEGNEEND